MLSFPLAQREDTQPDVPSKTFITKSMQTFVECDYQHGGVVLRLVFPHPQG
ncbi:hypothetical protein AB0H73_24815 [Streptomyces olivoreticuli]